MAVQLYPVAFVANNSFSWFSKKTDICLSLFSFFGKSQADLIKRVANNMRTTLLEHIEGHRHLRQIHERKKEQILFFEKLQSGIK